MSDNDNTGPGGTLINFPRIGFNLNPTTTLPAPAGPPSDDTDDGVPAPRRAGRRSPLDALAALPAPGLTLPVLPSPQPGQVPATFHNDPNPDTSPGSPGLGALSMAATLAVAIAALRGTHTVLSTWWENRQARHAETAQLREARFKHQLAMQQAGYSLEQAGAKHSAAMQGIRGKGAQQRARTSSKVPSSSEFGRKTLGSRSGSGAGGGAGRSGGSSTGPKKTGDLFGRGGGSSSSRNGGLGSKGRGKNNGSPLAGGTRKKNAGSGSGGGPKKSPHRGSQGGSKAALDKGRTKKDGGKTPSLKSNGSGSGGTGLGAALKKDTQKAAARRWKKRQKHGAATPALWGNTPKNQKKGPGQGGKGQHAGGSSAAKHTPSLNKQKVRKTPQAQAAGANRKKVNQALWHDWKRAAARRWKKRQHQRKAGHVPPIWKARGHKNNKQQQAAAAGANTPKVNLNKPKHAGTTPRAGAANGGQAGRQQQRKQKNRRWWAKARAYAQKKAAGGGWFPGAAPGPGATPGAGQATGNNPGPGGAYGNRQRRSPYANAGQAAGTTYTVTSDHVPGSQARRWEPSAGTPALPSTGPAALNAAPVKTFPRPSTTRPKEAIPMPPAKPDRRLAKARHQAARTGLIVTAQARHMDPMHETEITLDDAIDEYGEFKDDAFKTHDKCFKLAERARQLRDTLALFALELATKHNLIGALFTGALARLSESMDLLARMAEEMQVSSLEAAEMSEAADNALNDAYRPYNVATADAGLSTPSAPIHNET
jgi:hypothetical protein